jgi:hypothetical protein
MYNASVVLSKLERFSKQKKTFLFPNTHYVTLGVVNFIAPALQLTIAGLASVLVFIVVTAPIFKPPKNFLLALMS